MCMFACCVCSCVFSLAFQSTRGNFSISFRVHGWGFSKGFGSRGYTLL